MVGEQVNLTVFLFLWAVFTVASWIATFFGLKNSVSQDTDITIKPSEKIFFQWKTASI